MKDRFRSVIEAASSSKQDQKQEKKNVDSRALPTGNKVEKGGFGLTSIFGKIVD